MGHIMEDFLLINVFQSDAAMTRPFAQLVDEFRQQMPEGFRHLLVGPVAAAVNGCRNVVMFPDGSKTGWDDDATGIKLRSALVEHLRQHVDYVDAYLARFGDDDATITEFTEAERAS